MYRRHGLCRGQNLRPGSVAAGAKHLPRDQLVQQLRRLPGPPHAGPLPPRRKASQSWCTPSTAQAWQWAVRWWRYWRTTSRPTVPSRYRPLCAPMWVAQTCCGLDGCRPASLLGLESRAARRFGSSPQGRFLTGPPSARIGPRTCCAGAASFTPERWQSGRMHRIRNPAYGSSRTEGSNPSLSARLRAQRCTMCACP